MRFRRFSGFGTLFLAILTLSFSASAQAKAPLKEWNLLIFMNGKNDLDQYGAMNINQLESTGSTAQMNILVQWGSLENQSTRRLLVQKDQSTEVTSPILQDLGPKYDMGDYRNLIDFANWAHQNFPAKHYFVVIWNHGTGWRFGFDGGRQTRDISNDDLTGHTIRTEELAYAMGMIARIIGHKVDIYGSDACLMGMVEVAAQMANYVEVFVGSEEVEPAEGWPYGPFLSRWATNPYASAEQIATLLTQEFKRAYSPGGIYPQAEVTLSAIRTNGLKQLQGSLYQLAAMGKNLNPPAFKSISQAVASAQAFDYTDYVDLGDLLRKLYQLQLPEMKESGLLQQVAQALRATVISNQVTSRYAKATGLSVWFPTYTALVQKHGRRYMGLEFAKNTGWAYLIDWTIKGAKLAAVP